MSGCRFQHRVYKKNRESRCPLINASATSLPFSGAMSITLLTLGAPVRFLFSMALQQQQQQANSFVNVALSSGALFQLSLTKTATPTVVDIVLSVPATSRGRRQIEDTRFCVEKCVDQGGKIKRVVVHSLTRLSTTNGKR